MDFYINTVVKINRTKVMWSNSIFTDINWHLLDVSSSLNVKGHTTKWKTICDYLSIANRNYINIFNCFEIVALWKLSHYKPMGIFYQFKHSHLIQKSIFPNYLNKLDRPCPNDVPQQISNYSDWLFSRRFLKKCLRTDICTTDTNSPAFQATGIKTTASCSDSTE